MRLIEYFWKDPFNFKVIKQTNSLTEVKQALLDYYLEEVKPEPGPVIHTETDNVV